MLPLGQNRPNGEGKGLARKGMKIKGEGRENRVGEVVAGGQAAASR